jgi:hypothetical protein
MMRASLYPGAYIGMQLATNISRHSLMAHSNTTEPQRYNLLQGTNGNLDQAPLLQLFETFLQKPEVRALAQWDFTETRDNLNGSLQWEAKLTSKLTTGINYNAMLMFSSVNGHPVLDAIGVGASKSEAKKALIKHLHVNKHRVLVSVLLVAVDSALAYHHTRNNHASYPVDATPSRVSNIEQLETC